MPFRHQTYYNHSSEHRVRVMIPDATKGRAVPPRMNPRTRELYKEERVIWVEPLGKAEIPLPPEVVAMKAPQLSLKPPKDPKAYDAKAKTGERQARVDGFAGMIKADLYGIFEFLGVDLASNVKRLREADPHSTRDPDADPVKAEMAELLVRFEEKVDGGSKRIADALDHISHSGDSGLPAGDTGQ